MLLLVDAEEVPWRFGLRSDNGMMAIGSYVAVTINLQVQISAELEDGQEDIGWILRCTHKDRRRFSCDTNRKMCAVSSTSFQVDLTAGWGLSLAAAER